MHFDWNLVYIRVCFILHFFDSTLNLFGKVLKYFHLIKIFGSQLFIEGNDWLEWYFRQQFLVLVGVHFDGYFVEVGVGKGFDFCWHFFYVMRKLFACWKETKIFGNPVCYVHEIWHLVKFFFELAVILIYQMILHGFDAGG